MDKKAQYKSAKFNLELAEKSDREPNKEQANKIKEWQSIVGQYESDNDYQI